jgi:hypothetical protein
MALLVAFGCAARPLPSQPREPADARGAAPGLRAGAAVATSGPLRIELRASGMGQLGYHLDCLAGLERCTRDRIEALWTQTLGWSDRDDAMLDEWTALGQRYHTSVRLDRDPAPGVYPVPARPMGLRDKLRQAAFLADDLPAYQRHVSLLMTPADAARHTAVLAHFAPRFARWWQAGPAAEAAALARDLGALLGGREVEDWLLAVAAFYGVRLAENTPVHVHVVLLPGGAPTGTVAEQIENHIVLEALPGESALARAPVLLHELCHFFYRSMAPDAHQRLMAALLGSGEAAAVGALHLLDESVAAALGNGVAGQRLDPQRFQRRMARPRGLYDDALIDPVARALLPALGRLLAAGETLHGGAFAGEYLAAYAAALGEASHTPALRLRTAAVLLDGDGAAATAELDPVLRALRERLGVAAMYAGAPIDAAASQDALRAYPTLSGLIAVRYAHLDQLESWRLPPEAGLVERLRGLARRHRAFVYELVRSSQASVYIVAGRDAEAMAEAVALLAGLGRTQGGVIAVVASR